MANMPNMQKMMKQMQKMQRDMEATQQSLNETIFEAQDTNGLVQVKVNGNREIVALEIKEELVDPEDIEMLQDLIIATVNDALNKVEQATQEQMGRFTQGLNLPF